MLRRFVSLLTNSTRLPGGTVNSFGLMPAVVMVKVNGFAGGGLVGVEPLLPQAARPITVKTGTGVASPPDYVRPATRAKGNLPIGRRWCPSDCRCRDRHGRGSRSFRAVGSELVSLVWPLLMVPTALIEGQSV